MKRPSPFGGPVACTMHAIGDEWSAVILDELLVSRVARFGDLRIRFPNMSPNTLSLRLKALEDRGLVERQCYCPRPLRWEYAPTDLARSLVPVFRAMGVWGRERLNRRRSWRRAFVRAHPDQWAKV